MYCGKCGKRLFDDAKFCFNCGTPVHSQKEAVQVQQVKVDNPNLNDQMETQISFKEKQADYLKKLNADQQCAIETTEGYVRVVAGAGSGKTRALTCRFIYLVDQMGVSPANILCVTFTNKAAREMKNRIHTYLGDADLGMICTFHGFCVKVLKEDSRKIGYPRNFLILDTDDQETILKKVYENCGYKSTDVSFREAIKHISLYKNGNISKYLEWFEAENEEVLYKLFREEQSTISKILYGYLYEQRKCFAFDFDDLINAVLYIFEKYQEVLDKWQKRLEYIMVDEFQDVGKREYALCAMLSQYHKNLFVVGDPDQTIYSFRGADVKRILDFDKQFLGTQTIMMNTNYRSTKDIIDVSNSLISKNTLRIDKQLSPVRGNETLVVYNHAKTARDEMEWIAQQVELLNNNEVPYSAIAVLYRAHYVTREIEEALMRHKMPYVIYSGVPFYGRKEIKDVLSYLRMLTTGDDFSFLRTINEPKRNFGKKRVDFLTEYQSIHRGTLYEALKANLNNPLIEKTKASTYVALIESLKERLSNTSLSDLMKTVLRESGYEDMLRLAGDDDRLENIAELEQSIVDYENSAGETVDLSDYLAMVALYTNVDKEEKKNRISLMTIHTAKGLEFPYVFVCALSEGIFPSSKSKTKAELEEERRLAYVAFTRAKNALFLSDSEGINFDQTYRFPSRFIFNIDRALLHYSVELDQKLIDSARAYIKQTEAEGRVSQKTDEMYSVGMKVMHRLWGEGVIIAVKKESSALEIKWEKFETTRHISFDAAKSVISVVKQKKDTDSPTRQLSEEGAGKRTNDNLGNVFTSQEYEKAISELISLAPHLKRALEITQLEEVRDNIVHVSFARNNLMYMKILERKILVLEEAMTKAFGRPMKIEMSIRG